MVADRGPILALSELTVRRSCSWPGWSPTTAGSRPAARYAHPCRPVRTWGTPRGIGSFSGRRRGGSSRAHGGPLGSKLRKDLRLRERLRAESGRPGGRPPTSARLHLDRGEIFSCRKGATCACLAPTPSRRGSTCGNTAAAAGSRPSATSPCLFTSSPNRRSTSWVATGATSPRPLASSPTRWRRWASLGGRGARQLHVAPRPRLLAPVRGAPQHRRNRPASGLASGHARSDLHGDATGTGLKAVPARGLRAPCRGPS